MILWLIVRRSLGQHALSTVVTAGSVALATGLLMTVWVVKEQAQRTFAGVSPPARITGVFSRVAAQAKSQLKRTPVPPGTARAR